MEREPEERTPRWVVAFAVVAAVLVLLVVILHLTGLAPHGHAPPR